MPIALTAIFVLLQVTFGAVRQALLVLANIPFALIGGVFALWVSGEYLSVPASVGFIALLGIAVLNGVVMVTVFNQLRSEGLGMREAVLEGATKRLRPVAMTAGIAALGLLPLLFAHRARIRDPAATGDRRRRRAGERHSAHAADPAGAVRTIRRGGARRAAHRTPWPLVQSLRSARDAR